VIVENRAGAAGVLGADLVAKSPKDGSVLLLTSSSFLTAAATQAQLPYDPVTAFAPVAVIGRGPMLLAVSAQTPYRTPADVVAAARAKPGVLNYGTAGVGSIAHLTTELFDDAAKVKMTHVPYKGAAPAAVDLAGGRIDAMISNYSTLAPLMASGKIRALGVTSATSHSAFPDLPPLAGVAPGFDVDIWVGVFAPAGTPAALVDRLNEAIVAVSASSELTPVLQPDGALPEAISPGAFAARLKAELAQWKALAAEHRITAE
jgi:tripartite-type tricarboxylate transporter receptor subunit TctC